MSAIPHWSPGEGHCQSGDSPSTRPWLPAERPSQARERPCRSIPGRDGRILRLPDVGSESGDAIERHASLVVDVLRVEGRDDAILTSARGGLVNGPHNPSRAFKTRLNLRRVAMRSVRFCWLAQLAKVPPSCWRHVPRRLRQALSRTNLLGQRRESHRGNQNRSREIPAAVPYQAQQQYLHTIH